MENSIPQKERKELQKRLIRTLEGQISHLSAEFQQILADDLITALQSRLTALTRIQARQKSAKLENILGIHKSFIHTPTKQS